MNFNILFPDNREKGETALKQGQLVMLRMLKVFDYLCRKYDIKYFLTGGTLLGAIRHKGFIPWDDDLDVGMTRDQYDKFVQIAVPKLREDIFFQNPETDAHYPSFHLAEAKLRDKYSSYVNNRSTFKWHTGLQVDIFVYDKAYLPHNIFLYMLNRFLIFFFKKQGNKKRAAVLNWIAKHSPFHLVYASSYIQNLQMVKFGRSYKREKEIMKVIRAQFEDAEVCIPVGWENYLKRMYGNYLKLPPIEKQVSNHSEELPESL